MKRAVIVGASGAIGNEFLNHFVEDTEYSRVYALSQSTLPTLSSKVKAIQVKWGEESSLEEAAQCISEEGQLDTLIIATGLLHTDTLFPERSLKEITARSMQEIYYANCVLPALLIKFLSPLLKKKEPTCLAVLLARVGSITDNGLGGWYSYRCSKAAAAMFLKNTSIELARTHPKCCAIGLHPGTVESTLSAPFQRNIPEGKLFTPKRSVSSMLQVIFSSKQLESGCHYAYDGCKIEP